MHLIHVHERRICHPVTYFLDQDNWLKNTQCEALPTHQTYYSCACTGAANTAYKVWKRYVNDTVVREHGRLS